jgi:transposase-like protein
MRRIVDASAASLLPFIKASMEANSIVHTDGWLDYKPLGSKGYDYEVTFLEGKKETPVGIDAASTSR